MSLCELNRRNLCKTFVTLGLLTLSDGLRAVGIGKAAESNRPAAGRHATDQEGLINVLIACPAKKRKHRETTERWNEE